MGQPQNGPDQPGETSNQEWEAGALEILAACLPLARRLVAFDRYMGEPVEFTEADQKAFLSFSDLHRHIFSLSGSAGKGEAVLSTPGPKKGLGQLAGEGREAHEQMVTLAGKVGYKHEELLVLMSLVALQQNTYSTPAPASKAENVPTDEGRKPKRRKHRHSK